jgi:hypothetical protein
MEWSVKKIPEQLWHAVATAEGKIRDADRDLWGRQTCIAIAGKTLKREAHADFGATLHANARLGILAPHVLEQLNRQIVMPITSVLL